MKEVQNMNQELLQNISTHEAKLAEIIKHQASDEFKAERKRFKSINKREFALLDKIHDKVRSTYEKMRTDLNIDEIEVGFYIGIFRLDIKIRPGNKIYPYKTILYIQDKDKDGYYINADTFFHSGLNKTLTFENGRMKHKPIKRFLTPEEEIDQIENFVEDNLENRLLENYLRNIKIKICELEGTTYYDPFDDDDCEECYG